MADGQLALLEDILEDSPTGNGFGGGRLREDGPPEGAAARGRAARRRASWRIDERARAAGLQGVAEARAALKAAARREAARRSAA